MLLVGKKIGFALTGSFCTFEKTIKQMERLIEEGADILPIMSYNSYNLDSKFGKAKDFIDKIENLTGKKIINTIQGAEPIGPKNMTEIMVIAPCSRKYNRENSKWNNRYTSTNGYKCTSNLMAETNNLHNSNKVVELDCDVISSIFKKLKNKGVLGQAVRYNVNNKKIEEIEELSNSTDFMDLIKMHRLRKNISMREIAQKIGKDDEVYRQYELKHNEIQDYKIAENIIKALNIENILELPDYFKIMKKYSKENIIEIVNKIGKKKFSKETNIAISTINYWNQKNSSKTLSTYTYKKMVDVFKKYKIKY